MTGSHRQVLIRRAVVFLGIFFVLAGFGFVAGSTLNPRVILSHAPSLKWKTIKEILSRLRGLGAVYVIIGALILGLRNRVTDTLSDGFESSPQSIQPKESNRWSLIFVGLITAIGALARWVEIHRVVRYDEAFTYEFYASRALYAALGDYSLPNNHLAHTLLVWLSTHLFGASPESLRFPSFLAGVAILPAMYFVGRKLYGDAAGIAACALGVTSPALIEFSINSRGYSLVCLCSLVMLGSVQVLNELPAKRSAWMGFMISAIVAVYTIPLALIPVIGIALWGVAEARGDRLASVWRYAAVLGGVAVCVVILYSPPFLHNGLSAIVANKYVASKSTDTFFPEFLRMPQRVWTRWNDGLSAAVSSLLGGLFVLALIVHRRIAKHRVPVFVFVLVWSICFALVGRIVGYPRVWLFVLPVFLMTCGAGLAWLLESAQLPAVVAGFAAAVIALGMGWVGRDTQVFYWSNETGALQDGTAVADFVQQTLQPDDALVMSIPAMPTIVYEANRKYGVDLLRRPIPDNVRRVLVVLAKTRNRTEVDDSLHLRDLLKSETDADTAILADPRFLSELEYDDMKLSREVWGTPRLLESFESVSVYAVPVTTVAEAGSH